MIRFLAVCAALALCGSNVVSAQTSTPAPASVIEDAFRPGVMVQDTNGDTIADAICGHILVPAPSSVAENTAAANLAARLGYETIALTLPVVVSTPTPAGKFCATPTTDLWIGREALPAAPGSAIAPLLAELQLGEGGVYAVPDGLLVEGEDPVGLLAAAAAYSARAPFQWSVSGEPLQAIAHAINARLAEQKIAASVELVGLTYQSSQPGIHRAILQVSGSATAAAIRAALVPAEGESPLHGIIARELQLRLPNASPLTISIAAALGRGCRRVPTFFNASGEEPVPGGKPSSLNDASPEGNYRE